MTAVLMTPPYLQFFDSSGLPLNGGKLYTYTATGTFTVQKATYTDSTGVTPQANPIILDSAGRCTPWLSGTYDFKVTDSLDNVIETTQGVTAFTTLPTSSDSYFQTFSGTGAQTAFTTSSDLGTDEKSIYVWVDSGAGKGYEIQNVTAYTINGTTLTFSSAPASGTNNIYVSAPSLLVGAASSAAANASASASAAASSASSASTSASSASSSATSASGSASAASASATAAANSAAALSATVTTVTSTSNATTINLSTSRAFKHTFTENTTFTFSNPDATGTRCIFEIYLFQDSTGRTPTWPATVKWSNATAPTLTTANAKYLVSFVTIDGGTTYIGTLGAEAYA